MSSYDRTRTPVDLDKLIAHPSHRQLPMTDEEETHREIRRWLELADTLLSLDDSEDLLAAA